MPLLLGPLCFTTLLLARLYLRTLRGRPFKRKQLLDTTMATGRAIWELSAFRSLFADPFAEGNELEAVGHAAEALLVRARIMTLFLAFRLFPFHFGHID